MTDFIVTASEPPQAVATSNTSATSYVDFGAVVAGALMALAVSFVLLTFGAAVGFSAISPWSTTAAGKVLTLGAAFWVLLVEAWSFALGGYLSGRMRHRWHDGQASEVAFRDGAHGLLTWGLAIVVAGVMALAANGMTGRSTSDPYRLTDPANTVLDPLFRPTEAALAKPDARMDDSRAEAARILATSLTRTGVSAADKTYLAQLVAARTGVPQPEAERRVSAAIEQTKAAADKGRRLAVVLGFLTATSLLIGAAVAWWAASIGGQHRDAGTVWHGFSDFSHPSLPKFG